MTQTTPTLRMINHVPEGRAAWLSYRQHAQLKGLLDRAAKADGDDSVLAALADFLQRIAKLSLPPEISDAEIQRTAFTLIRRGYEVEEMSPAEYGALRVLFDGLERPDSDDMALHPEGGHRRLYNHLVKHLGLDVDAGRGPVWRRAKDLIETYEAQRSAAGASPVEAATRLAEETRAMFDAIIAEVDADTRPVVARILAAHLAQAQFSQKTGI